MSRTLIADLRQHIEETVTIETIVDVVRNQGKMAFFDFHDRTSVVQGVIFGKPELLASVQDVKQVLQSGAKRARAKMADVRAKIGIAF